MMLKTLAVLLFVAVVSALPVEDAKAPIKESRDPALVHTLPVEDIKAPIKESSGHALGHGPVLVPAGPVLVAAPGPVLSAETGPALGPALVAHTNVPKGESDLKTDATQWSYYRYNNGYHSGPSVYSYNTPAYYSYWNSYW